MMSGALVLPLPLLGCYAAGGAAAVLVCETEDTPRCTGSMGGIVRRHQFHMLRWTVHMHARDVGIVVCD